METIMVLQFDHLVVLRLKKLRVVKSNIIKCVHIHPWHSQSHASYRGVVFYNGSLGVRSYFLRPSSLQG